MQKASKDDSLTESSRSRRNGSDRTITEQEQGATLQRRSILKLGAGVAAAGGLAYARPTIAFAALNKALSPGGSSLPYDGKRHLIAIGVNELAHPGFVITSDPSNVASFIVSAEDDQGVEIADSEIEVFPGFSVIISIVGAVQYLADLPLVPGEHAECQVESGLEVGPRTIPSKCNNTSTRIGKGTGNGTYAFTLEADANNGCKAILKYTATKEGEDDEKMTELVEPGFEDFLTYENTEERNVKFFVGCEGGVTSNPCTFTYKGSVPT